jgi:NADH-quinone oxidoreductase subunit H
MSILVRVLLALVLMLVNGVVLIYMLRKVLAHLHLRVGPNRVGPWGVFQTSIDVLKLLTKEDFIPAAADHWLFRLAPYMVFVPSFMAYAALVLGPRTAFSRLDTGLLYVFAVLAIVPMGVMMAGWASNSKWSLIGGMRAAAQQISYEVPLLLSVLPIVMTAGSMSLTRIVQSQTGYALGFIPRWNFFSPQLVGFALFLVAALAELNQTPFDMSEAESELISGFANEYSGMRFGLLFLSEFSNSFVISALGATLFFGGWLVPGVDPASPVMVWLGPVAFIIKTYLGIFVLMWIRGTMPRIRIDQMLELGWKALIPLSLVWLMITGFILQLVRGVG